MRVAVYSIARNEEQFVDRWAASAQGADHLAILDTGSTDATIELAEAAGVTAHSAHFHPWRFDHARNAALALLPDDVDLCVALDLDEILLPGWRQQLEVAWQQGITRPRYRYVWSWRPDGSPGLVYGGEKIHARHGYRWRHPVHEVLVPDDGVEVTGWVDLEIHHHPDPGKPRTQYLPLLRLAVEEDPDDDRNAFYYARELLFAGQLQEAGQQFARHLSLPSARWAPERAASMRYLATIPGWGEERWLLRAAAECPDRREPWVDLAGQYYRTAQWAACYAAATRALQIVEQPLEYLCEPHAWGATPHDYAAIAAHWLGLPAEAIGHGERAAELEPDDPRLTENLRHYRKGASDARSDAG